MSFILDALRKSEHDRQRQTGPGLAEVPMAPSRPKSNVWATAAVALLVVNLIGIGVVLLRRADHEAPADAGTTSATPAATAAVTTPAAPQASVVQEPVLQPAAPPTAAPGRNPLASEVSGGPPDIDAGMAASAASVPAGPPAVSRAPAYGTGAGSVRYEPIEQAAVARAVAAESRAPPPPVASTAQPALPTADEMMASGGMPQLHLDLHVYSARPQERFVFVNSHKYREGDALQEGPTVEQITQAGAILSYRGSRFLLSRD